MTFLYLKKSKGTGSKSSRKSKISMLVFETKSFSRPRTLTTAFLKPE